MSVNKKRQVDEIRRCARDPLYFFKTYARVSHPIKGPVPFETYPFQDDCVHAFLENRFVIVNKSRQLGLSTLAAAYSAWLLLFHRNKEIVIMATKLQPTAMNFVRKVKTVINSLPKWLVLPRVAEDNKTSIVFGEPSNSRITAIPTTEDAGRSEALSLLIVDEAAHVDHFEEIWKGLYSTLSTGGRALIISTPNGVGNFFHKLWVDAHDGRNEFHPIELPWDVHPERDEDWFEHEKGNMSEQQVSQELLCDFLASGRTYLDAADIAWVGQAISPPISREGPDRNVWIWQERINDPTVKYIMPADVGRGDGNDYSAFHVICTMTGDVVAEFRGKLRPDIFAQLLIEYAKKYNNALVCPEKNTYGNHVIIEMINRGYSHLYFKNQTILLGDYVPPEAISDAGFDTQRESRKRIVSKLEEVIRNKQITVHSARLYDELKTFIIKNDKPEAQRNCHDDLVMALAIGVWLFDVDGVHSQFASQLNSSMLSGFGLSSNKYENMKGNGNEVLPSWIGMTPYVGGPGGPQTNRSRVRPESGNPFNVDWLLF